MIVPSSPPTIENPGTRAVEHLKQFSSRPLKIDRNQFCFNGHAGYAPVIPELLVENTVVTSFSVVFRVQEVL